MKRLVDAEAKGRVRKASLVPVTVCCAALTEFGRTDATSALLKAMNKLPKKWQLNLSSVTDCPPLPHPFACQTGSSTRTAPS